MDRLMKDMNMGGSSAGAASSARGKGKGDNPFGPYPKNEREDRYVSFLSLMTIISSLFGDVRPGMENILPNIRISQQGRADPSDTSMTSLMEIRMKRSKKPYGDKKSKKMRRIIRR